MNSNELQKELMKLRNEFQILNKNRRHQDSLNKLLEAWELIPIPKINTSFCSVLAQDISLLYLEGFQDYENALKWGNFVVSYYEKKGLSSVGDFLVGKIYYEMNDFNNAKKYFSIAMKKSEGRIFQGKDEKYINLIQGGSTPLITNDN